MRLHIQFFDYLFKYLVLLVHRAALKLYSLFLPILDHSRLDRIVII